jgi:CheY-like chemotaxis protein
MSSCRILHVEDDASERELFDIALHERGLDAEIEAVDGIVSCLKRLAQSPRPNLVLSDFYLSDGDACELLERIAAKKLGAGLPVLVISGQFPPGSEEECLRLGAQECLAKPWDIAGFELIVQRVTELCC